MRERAAEHETRNQKTERAGQTGIGIWKTAAKRKTGKRGEEKQGKEIVSNYDGLFEGGGKYDTIGVWKEK